MIDTYDFQYILYLEFHCGNFLLVPLNGYNDNAEEGKKEL
jgi:hypothetical protein